LIGDMRRAFKWGAAKELVPVAVYQVLLTIGTLKRGRTAAREPSPVAPVADAAVDASASMSRASWWPSRAARGGHSVALSACVPH
jgi:hypothetical protein